MLAQIHASGDAKAGHSIESANFRTGKSLAPAFPWPFGVSCRMRGRIDAMTAAD
jgi:hypothetical protein